jgi:hypothetical protein
MVLTMTQTRITTTRSQCLRRRHGQRQASIEVGAGLGDATDAVEEAIDQVHASPATVVPQRAGERVEYHASC